MPRIGILFDIDGLGGGMYGFRAYKIFFDALDPRAIPGCIVRDGDTNATLSGNARHFCISVESYSQATIGVVRDAFTKADAPGLLPVSSRFLDEIQLRNEPLPLSFRTDQSGDLVDVEYSLAVEALEECRKKRTSDVMV
ncbi:MAG: hypothetical protein ACLQPD_18985 [Desulfomonilaceae bacterium]